MMELIVSVAVSGLLVAGLTSTLYVASRAVNLSGPPGDALDGSRAASDLLGELGHAVTFTQRSAHAIEFTVADRDNDALPETIRYAWSGIPGDPLTRQQNGAGVAEVVQGVHQFDLAYHLTTAGKQTVVSRVGIKLQVGADSASRIDSAVGSLNAPEVASP